MPETYSIQDKPTQELFLLRHKNRKMAGWDDAIVLAKERLESLKAVVKVFERYRDTGEPFIEHGEDNSDMAA